MRDAAGARIAAAARDGDRAIACLSGAGAPDEGPVITERVDVPSEGDAGCERRLRFTFRHDGVVVRTRCPSEGRLVIEAESTLGRTELATIDAAPPAIVTVPWAGDWNGDRRLEWIVRVDDAAGLRYLGVFELRDDDTIATRAEHRP